jgi:anti-sigma regulatory factor (Ser/Thr protein kinase)
MKPKWDEIENVRKKSHDFLVSHGLENDSVHAFTMVIRELIENSVKYGKGPIPENYQPLRGKKYLCVLCASVRV